VLAGMIPAIALAFIVSNGETIRLIVVARRMTTANLKLSYSTYLPYFFVPSRCRPHLKGVKPADLSVCTSLNSHQLQSCRTRAGDNPEFRGVIPLQREGAMARSGPGAET
jgi:hypothetical protein